MNNIHYNRVNLRGAYFRGAYFRGAYFRGAKMPVGIGTPMRYEYAHVGPGFVGPLTQEMHDYYNVCFDGELDKDLENYNYIDSRQTSQPIQTVVQSSADIGFCVLFIVYCLWSDVCCS